MAGLSAISRQIDVLKIQLGQTRTEAMVAAAHQAFSEAQAQNRAALGREPDFEQIVDGIRGAALESVKPGGTIVYAFAVGAVLLAQATDFAISTFLHLAPVGRGKDPHPGQYRDSLVLLVNGERRDAAAGEIVTFQENDVVSLTSLLPYSRKLELGTFRLRVPDGTMHSVTAATQGRYGGLLKVRLTFENYPGFAVGRTRKGGALRTAADHRRASSYPTVTMSLK